MSGGGRFVSDNGAELGAAAAPPVAHYQAPRVAPPPRSTRPAPRPRARDPPRVHAPASGTVNRRSIYGATARPAGAARRSTVPAQRGSGSSSTRFVPTRSVGARGSRRQDDPSPVSDEAIDVRVLPRRVVLRATDWGPVLPSPGLTSCHGVCGSCCACPLTCHVPVCQQVHLWARLLSNHATASHQAGAAEARCVRHHAHWWRQESMLPGSHDAPHASSPTCGLPTLSPWCWVAVPW